MHKSLSAGQAWPRREGKLMCTSIAARLAASLSGFARPPYIIWID